MRSLGSVGWLFVLVCCWWVLGSLVLPMVLPLVSGVSAGEGVVASGLGVGGGAGVGVVVPGPGVGRGCSGVTGCGRSPLLAAGLVGPPLRPSGFWRPCSPPGGLLGSCCLGLCVLRVWCRRRLCFGVWCALVGLVSVAVVGVCVVCTLGRVCGVLVVRWGACPRLCGRGLAALFGVGAVCRAPPPCLGCVVPRPPWLGSVGGASPCCPLCVCPPPSVSFPCRLGRCRARAFPAVVCGGGSLSPARVPSPGVSPWGSRCLHSPSGCNSVVRMPSMDLFRSQVLQPFPTPGSGTLWVAGESSRDRRVSCLPRWTVCPTRSPSLGPNRSTCRGECSWSGPLVTPPGRCHRGPLTNGPGRIPPYCVCSGGADTVTGGGPKPLRLGPSPAPPVGPFRPAPLFAVRFAVVGVPSLRGGVVVVGGGGVRCSWLCCLRACRPLLWSCGGGAWCVVCGVRWWCVGGVVGGVWCGWSLATPGGGSCVLLPATPGWVSLPVVVGGPRHSWLGSAGGGGVWCVAVVCWLLVPRHSWRRFLCATPRHSWLGFAAGGGGRSPPLLAGVRWRRWCVVCGGGVLVVGPSPLLAEVPVCYSPPLLAGFRCRRWCVVCGVWCAACGVRRWRVWWVCGWCGWSLATPGGGSCVLLPATPGWGPLAAVVCGVWRWCVFVVGPSPLLAEVPVCYSPPLLAGFRCRWWWAVPATPGWGPLAAVVCGVWRWCVGCWSLATPGGGSCVLLPATPGWVSLPAVVRGVRCVVCGVWRAACGVGVCGGFVAGVVGPSPLLAEVPVCYSPPLLAGFRCRWWWAVPATPGWGPLAAVVCGVWRWCVGC